MAQYDYILPTLTQIKKSSQRHKLAEDVLNARIDAQVTASTDNNEVIDARVDSWGNTFASLGSNIRDGQIRLSLNLELLQSLFQAQIDALAEARLVNSLNIADSNEIRRREIASEEQNRTADDNSLQRQINSLSEAVLEILVIISEIREKGRKT